MIGIFDSGVGGMTVARAIEQSCPGYSFLYFGDIAHTPYGSKSPDTIREYAVRNSNFLISQGAKLIVIACNTASCVAADHLRHLFDIPFIDVISPAVEKAVTHADLGPIGVIGTRATVNSNVYEKSILAEKASAKVYSQACPLLVPLVEEGWTGKKETKMILRKYLQPLRLKQVTSLVLGCTHYPLLKSEIQPRIGKRTLLIDSSIETAQYLCRYLQNHPALAKATLTTEPSNRFFVSDITESVQTLADTIFDRPINLEKIHV